MAPARVFGIALAYSLLATACLVAFADRSRADEAAPLLAQLKDPARRELHARVALDLGRLSDPGLKTQEALSDALAREDPVLAACAAHALARVGRPSVALFDALIRATAHPVTIRSPEPNATGWGSVNDRAFTSVVLYRSGDGWTDWIVFRTWGEERVAQLLHVPNRDGEPGPPGGPLSPSARRSLAHRDEDRAC